MITFGVVATKGGVGKTTIAANLGGLLADIGYRVLLVDADVQPSLSRYFEVAHEAEHGLTKMVMDGVLTAECVSTIELPPSSFPGDQDRLNKQGGALHLVRSDTRDGKLQDWLSNRLDRLVRIRMAIKQTPLSANYDVAIIDTQGAVGPHHAYLFANKRANRIKILVHDGIGIWLAARRLHQGKFIWPLAGGSNHALQRQQLDALVMGLPWQRLADGGVITVV